MSNVANPTRPGANENRGNTGNSGNPGNTSHSESTASAVMDKAKEAASYVGEQAKAAMHKAEEAASAVGQRAEDATHAAGAGLKSLGGTVRGYSPDRNVVRDATNCVAETLENTGKYLEEEGLSGMAHDMTNLIKRNPIPALFIGVGVGFLLARALNRS